MANRFQQAFRREQLKKHPHLHAIYRDRKPVNGKQGVVEHIVRCVDDVDNVLKRVQDFLKRNQKISQTITLVDLNKQVSTNTLAEHVEQIDKLNDTCITESDSERSDVKQELIEKTREDVLSEITKDEVIALAEKFASEDAEFTKRLPRNKGGRPARQNPPTVVIEQQQTTLEGQ